MSIRFTAFSGVPDTDLLIFSNLDDHDLLSACLSNKYTSNLCYAPKYDYFWRNRFIDRFEPFDKKALNK